MPCVRVEVAGWDRHVHCRAPCRKTLDLRSVLSVPGENIWLQRDIHLLSDVEDKVPELPVGDHGAVQEENPGTVAQMLLSLGGSDSREVGCDSSLY